MSRNRNRRTGRNAVLLCLAFFTGLPAHPFEGGFPEPGLLLRSGHGEQKRAAATKVIVVNSAHDHPDDSVGDGTCDTGNVLAEIAECTLRAAIQEANATTGTDPVEIRIDILSPNRGGQNFGYDATHDTWTIPVNTPATGRPMGPLPAVSRSGVMIDGHYQKADPDGRFFDAACGNLLEGTPHRLKVKIDGTLLSASDENLTIAATATGFLVRGLVLSNSPGDGISSSADNAVFECLYVGTSFDGSAAEANWIGMSVSGENSYVTNSVISGSTDYGVHLSGLGSRVVASLIGTDRMGTAAIPNMSGVSALPGTVVGGEPPGARNVISGNGALGVYAIQSTVLGNFIGVDRTGSIALGNGGAGVSANTDAMIGVPGAGNVVSGNAGPGIDVYAWADNVQIQANLVGTDAGGTVAIPNGTNPAGGPGIENAGHATQIGGGEPGQGNLISGNSGDGIRIGGGSGIIQGNLVGTNHNGSSALPNGRSGLNDENNASNAASATVIGGGSPAARNVISGNSLRGVRLAGAEARVQGNYIGLNASGTAALPNGGEGILESGGYHLIGGDTPEAGNVISGNAGPGIRILGGGARVYHNAIGTNAARNEAVPNGDCGIHEESPGGLSIGAPEMGNLIAGNVKCGIWSQGSETTIRSNSIGFGEGVPIPNGPSPGTGIVVNGYEIEIGGVNPGEGNLVAFNTGHGIRVRAGVAGPGASAAILGNQIFENGGLGIDLEGGAEDGFGVTANDALDADSGPNGLLNYPVLFPVPNDGSQAVLAFHLDGLPNSTFRVELFVNEGPDPSTYGEGMVLRKTTNVATDVTGHASWSGSGSPGEFPPGSWVTATATHLWAPGDYAATSEFAAAVPVTAPGVEAHVRVWLEGAYTEGLMRTELAAAGRVPVAHPYGIPPFEYFGEEAVPEADGNGNGVPDYFEAHPDLVDWVLLELIAYAEDEYGAVGHVTVARRAAFLRSDGWIVEGDGSSEIAFANIFRRPYYLLVRHRNHLPVMSPVEAACTAGACVWDFTTAQSKAWGAPDAMRDLGEGAFGMVAGDADANGEVNESDRNDHWSPFNGLAGYAAPTGGSPDFDLNGQVQNTDKMLFWLPNLGRLSMLPPIDGE